MKGSVNTHPVFVDKIVSRPARSRNPAGVSPRARSTAKRRRRHCPAGKAVQARASAVENSGAGGRCRRPHYFFRSRSDACKRMKAAVCAAVREPVGSGNSLNGAFAMPTKDPLQ
jgi:hypothetical protein